MSEPNHTLRLEAFCDAVFAIAMTLPIIDVKLPLHEAITSADALWGALLHALPSIGAFVLSFTVILITWVNHHAHMKLVGKPTASFIYANGVLLLFVVFFPFPTSLLGEFIFTDHSAPAVVLYNATLGMQSLSS